MAWGRSTTVIHGDADSGYRPLSTAMVDLRATLDAAVGDGAVGAGERDVLIAGSERNVSAVAASSDWCATKN